MKMAVRWRQEFETGFPELDRQHRSIFEACERLARLAPNDDVFAPEVAGLVEELFAETEAHFLCEEDCMVRVACPVAQANMRAHDVFRESVIGFKNEIAASGLSQSLLKEIVEFVEGWLIAHICHTDIHLRACAKRSPPPA